MARSDTCKFSALALLAALALACGDDDAGRSPPELPTLDAGADESLDASASAGRDASRGGAAMRRDAGAQDAGDTPGPSTGSLDGGVASVASAVCKVTSATAHCDSRSIEQVGSASDLRRVYWNVPASPEPAAGYPAVILFQGSLYGPATSWNTDLGVSTMFGGYYQVVLIAELLAHGFVVIQPEAQGAVLVHQYLRQLSHVC